jgi:hypothetical protein
MRSKVMSTSVRERVSHALLLMIAAMIVGAPACGQSTAGAATATEAAIKPAIDGIFHAFETHSLVGLGDMHGLAQETELYKALIRDPRFARNVGNVVVEFGGAARQDVIDRYVSGGNVPYRELRQVWTDTVGWIPTVVGLGYAQFFATCCFVAMPFCFSDLQQA